MFDNGIAYLDYSISRIDVRLQELLYNTLLRQVSMRINNRKRLVPVFQRSEKILLASLAYAEALSRP